MRSNIKAEKYPLRIEVGNPDREFQINIFAVGNFGYETNPGYYSIEIYVESGVSITDRIAKTFKDSIQNVTGYQIENNKLLVQTWREPDLDIIIGLCHYAGFGYVDGINGDEVLDVQNFSRECPDNVYSVEYPRQFDENPQDAEDFEVWLDDALTSVLDRAVIPVNRKIADPDEPGVFYPLDDTIVVGMAPDYKFVAGYGSAYEEPMTWYGETIDRDATFAVYRLFK